MFSCLLRTWIQDGDRYTCWGEHLNLALDICDIPANDPPIFCDKLNRTHKFPINDNVKLFINYSSTGGVFRNLAEIREKSGRLD